MIKSAVRVRATSFAAPVTTLVSTATAATVATVVTLAMAAPASAQIRATAVVSGLAAPVGFVQDPSNPSVQYIVEQGGRIKVRSAGNLLATPFLDLSDTITSGGERGLLGLAFPPGDATSGRVYVNFTNRDGHTVVARFRRSTADPLRADPASRFDLRWSTGERLIRQPRANHNGGHLAFGPDGLLYIGLGDGGGADDPDHLAQDPTSLLGKMLRVDVGVADGDNEGLDVPADNPFVGGGARPEVWAFGLRNPWRYSFDDTALGGNGALIIADVGQAGREEINYQAAGRGGRNYGWRNREGTSAHIDTLPPAYLPLVDPIFEYPRSAGQSVTGGFVYRGAALGDRYRGRYFFGDFVSSRVWSIALQINRASGEATGYDLIDHTAELGVALGGISSFGVDAAGELHVVSFDGSVYRLSAAAVAPAPQIQIDAPVNGTTVSQPFALGGWALDHTAVSGTGIDTIHVWAYPSSGAPPIFVGVPADGGVRPDVGAAFGAQFAPSGYGLTVAGLAPGGYRLVLYGWVVSMGAFGVVQSVDVTIVAGTRVAIDIPRQSAVVDRIFHLGGWAFDPGASSGAGVDTIHVWAFPLSGGAPIFVGLPALGGSRPDVGAAFGARFTPSGYNLLVSSLAAGDYDLVVYAHSVVSNAFDAAGVVRISVR